MSAESRDTGNPLPIFIHVPKTGGTTFRSVILAQYPQERLCFIYPNGAFPDGTRHTTLEQAKHLPDSRLQSYDFASGHLFFGIHALFKRPFVYFSLLRDPAQRIFSLYNHLHGSKAIPLQVSLAKVLRGSSKKPWKPFANNQVKRLAGEPEGTGKDGFAATEQTLQLALENVEKHFAFVGVMEYFDETLVLASRMFGWRNPSYVAKNIRRTGSSWAVDDGTMELIRETNRFDILLYEALKQRFEALLARQDAGFTAEVEALRQRCREAAQTAALAKNAAGAKRRASTDKPAPSKASGSGIRGSVTRVLADRVVGWATSSDSAEPVVVGLMVNGNEIAVQRANKPRKNLVERGVHPTGECGFAFQLPPGQRLKPGDQVSVRVIGSDAELKNSPHTFTPDQASNQA